MVRTIYIQYPMCTRPTRLVGLYSDSCSLKQHSAGIHFASHGHLTLIEGQAVFAHSN